MEDPGKFWDQMYAVEHYRYGTAPNAFLQTVAPSLDANAHILCVGDGEGRNGVWLAEQGFRVRTIDPSAEGVRKATSLAMQRGAVLDVQRGRFPDDLTPADSRYDAIVLVYVHAPPPIREHIHSAAVERLSAGGVCILEGFTPAQLAFDSGGPRNEAMLFTEEMLRSDFAELAIESLVSAEVDLDEGPGHRGPAALIRMVARKR